MARYEERRGPEELFWDEPEEESIDAAESPAGRRRRREEESEDGADPGHSWQQFFHEPVRQPYGGAAGTGRSVPYGGRRFSYGRESSASREYGQLYGRDQRNYGHRRDSFYAADDAAPWWEKDPSEEGEESFVGFGPRGYRRSDARIEEEVVERLADADWVDASEIEVEVSDGVVTLRGEVATRDERRAAEEVAVEVTGVVDVINSLRARNRRLPTS